MKLTEVLLLVLGLVMGLVMLWFSLVSAQTVRTGTIRELPQTYWDEQGNLQVDLLNPYPKVERFDVYEYPSLPYINLDPYTTPRLTCCDGE